jgi:hypothetical protein
LTKLNKKSAMLVFFLPTVLAACGGFVYTTVGGNVKGLTTGSTLVLVNELGQQVSQTVDGSFSFRIASNASYSISVLQQPNPVNCTVANGSGKMTGEAAVTSIVVDCVPNVPLAGNLTNLDADKSLTLTVNDIGQTPLTQNGNFSFQSFAVNAKPYTVKVALPPASQVCNILNASGTANINNLPAAANIQVNCVPGVPVGGTLTGFKSTTALIITNNGKDVRRLIADGVFTFDFSYLNGESYDVQVTTQPAGQKCTVLNGTGKVSIAAPASSANVAVTCVAG